MPEEMLLEDGVDAEDVSEALAEEVKRFSEMHLRLKTQLSKVERKELMISRELEMKLRQQIATVMTALPGDLQAVVG